MSGTGENVTLTLYQVKERTTFHLTTVGVGPFTAHRAGTHPGKLEESLVNEVREKVRGAPPHAIEALELMRGTKLEHVHVELSLRGDGKRRKVAMPMPLVVQPRWANDTDRLYVAFHPFDQERWFPFDVEAGTLAEQAAVYFQEAWADLEDELLERMRQKGRDLLKVVSFRVNPKTLLDTLPKRRKGLWEDLVPDAHPDDAKRSPSHRGGYKVLPTVGVNLTARAIEGDLPEPDPRAPVSDQLRLLLCGHPRRPTVLLGPSGAGKTAMVHRLVHDLLAADDFSSHRNPDRAHAVWQLSGKRIIAGMSYLGDWEKRCSELLDDAKGHKAVLYFDDLHLLGRVGRSRESERNIADFLAGPVARGEVVVVGECTEEQFQRLEEDASSFAQLFTRVRVAPTDRAETFRLLVQTMRRLERMHPVVINLSAIKAVLEVGAPLIPHRALPGKALDLLHAAVRAALASMSRDDLDQTEVEWEHVIALLHERTGLPPSLLETTGPAEVATWREHLDRRVIGQREGRDAAMDLLARLAARMTDPRRPFAVYLFTGPTGTGKTEMARALAEVLYGDEQRLFRLDMGEYGTWDAASRLIGDRFEPEGILTRHGMQQPFSVVLFDEIEKAHPQVLNLLLQLFDEGRLTDASGATADFTRAVIVMTSNLGARSTATPGFGEAPDAGVHEHLRAVREFFSPELFNRIDRVVSFRPLTVEVARKVAAKELRRLTARRGLVDRGAYVTVRPAVYDKVVREAFRAADGARSLKRYLEDTLGTQLTERLVVSSGSAIQLLTIDVVDDAFSLTGEALDEALPVAARFALEEVDTASGPTLRAMVVDARARLAALRERPVEGDESAEARFVREDFQQRVDVVAERLEQLERSMSSGPDWDLEELEIVSREREYVNDSDRYSAVRPTRVYDRRAFRGDIQTASREAVVAALEGFHVLRHAAAALPRAALQVVRVELAEVTQTEGSRVLLLAMIDGVQRAATRVLGRWTSVPAKRRVSSAEELHGAVEHAGGDLRVALLVEGVHLMERLGADAGTHLLQGFRHAPEVLRVEVALAHEREDLEPLLLRERRPPLPVVRAFRYDAPGGDGSAAAPVFVDDYSLGLTRSWSASTPRAALPLLWRVRASGEEATS